MKYSQRRGIRVRRQRDRKKLLGEIDPRYRAFFLIGDRKFSKKYKHVAYISHDQFDSFMETLANDERISAETACALGMALSGGLRVSELLSLRRLDVEPSEGSLVFYSKVLKKKESSYPERDSVVHPAIQPLVEKLISKRRGLERIFKISRSGLWRQIKRYIGAPVDLHSLRHSLISKLAFGEHMDIMEICEMVRITPAIAASYSHIDRQEKYKAMWGVSE